ncbi:unnamed protein product, partial [Pylaiella littoralis]
DETGAATFLSKMQKKMAEAKLKMDAQASGYLDDPMVRLALLTEGGAGCLDSLVMEDLQASTAPAVAAKRKASSRGWRSNLCGTGGSTGYAYTPRRSKRQHQPEDKQGQEKSSEGNAPPGVVMSPDETNVPSSVPTPDVNPFAAEPQVHAAPWK